MKVDFIKLHVCILLAGFTGLFGKLISLNEGLLVWYRLLFAAIFALFVGILTRQLEKRSLTEYLKILGVGALLGLHWLFFYASIKYSNISIGVVCYSLIGFFTAILEPLINRVHFSFRDFFFSLITVAGIFLLFHFDMRYRLGVTIGVISSFCGALFTIMNKRIGKNYGSIMMLTWQLIGGFFFVSLVLPGYLYFFPVKTILPKLSDLGYLFIFASFCTVGMCLLQIQALKTISAFTVNLSFNLEPVYSIALAILFFNESTELEVSFYLGLSLIVLSVMLQTAVTIKEKRALELVLSGTPKKI